MSALIAVEDGFWHLNPHDVINVSFIGLVYYLFFRLHRSKFLMDMRNAPGIVGVEGGKFWPQSCVLVMIQCHCTQLTCSTLHYSTVHNYHAVHYYTV